jgi:hypothetical protein
VKEAGIGATVTVQKGPGPGVDPEDTEMEDRTPASTGWASVVGAR